MMPIKTMFGKSVLVATAAFAQATIDTNAGPWAAVVAGQVGDRLVAVGIITGGNASTTFTMTDSLGGTWTQIYTGSNTLPNRSFVLLVRDAHLTVAGNVTVTYTRSGSTGGGICLWRITGCRDGLYTTNGQTKTDPANGVPSYTSTAAAVQRSVMVGMVLHDGGAIAQPANWVADVQSGYASPTTTYTFAHCDAPNSTQTNNWGASTTNWCGFQLEFKPN